MKIIFCTSFRIAVFNIAGNGRVFIVVVDFEKRLPPYLPKPNSEQMLKIQNDYLALHTTTSMKKESIAYEDIYKAVSFLRYEAEQEDKRLREMKNKRR